MVGEVVLRWDGCESIAQLEPLNDAARQWIERQMSTQPWNWLGNRYCVNARYVEPLVSRMKSDGFEVRALP